MSRLPSVDKAAIEKKMYTVSYDCWLEDDESLTNFFIAVTPTTDPPLVAEGAYAASDFRSIVTYLSQGKVGSLYTVAFIADTSLGQRKRDDLRMRIT